MFDYYQVEQICATFHPYKFKLTPSNTGVNSLNARPVISCIDPETSVPGTPSGIASYGNMKVTSPEAVHTRKMAYHQLGMQKQDKVVLATNASNTARETYSEPANLSILV